MINRENKNNIRFQTIKSHSQSVKKLNNQKSVTQTNIIRNLAQTFN